jgi:hypothetical protein
MDGVFLLLLFFSDSHKTKIECVGTAELSRNELKV